MLVGHFSWLPTYLVEQDLVLGKRGNGRHQPAVAKDTLRHVKPAGPTREELWVWYNVLQT